MAGKQQQQVDVNFKASGLSRLKAQWADFAGELIEPVAILAAGGTKVQAAWAGVRGMFLTRVLGPLGMVAGASAALLVLTRNLTSVWKEMGLQSAKAVERLTIQFKPLLGSMELAKRRAREIFNFTVKSPFRFQEIADGNKMLQSLTKGALATKDGMTLVGDAAAVSGEGFRETARYVGRLYDGLQSGRPVGEAAMRLQEMGLISGQTRNQIESMQAANVAGNEIWRVVQKELQKTKGGMDDLAQSLEGLESTEEDTRQQLEAGFGKGFMKGEKAAIQSTITTMERMQPVAEYFGGVFGGISNAVAKSKAKLVDLATSIPGLTGGLQVLGTVVLGLATSVVLATGALIGKFIVGVVSAAAAARQLAVSSGSVAAAQAAQQAVTTALTGAKLKLAAASQAAARGEYVQAAAHMKGAAAQTAAAVRTNALAGSQAVLRGGLKLTGQGLRFVGGQLVAMTAAMLAMPVFWLAAGLVAIAGAAVYFNNKIDRAAEELRAFRKEGRDTLANLQEQRRAIRTVNDLRQAEAATLRALTAAHVAYENAVASGNRKRIGEARRQLEAMQAEMNRLRSLPAGSLDKTVPEIERENRIREGRRRAQDMLSDFEASKGADSEAREARSELASAERERARARESDRQDEAIRARKEAMQRGVDDESVREAALRARLEALGPRVKEGGPDRPALRRNRQIDAIEKELKAIDTRRREASGAAAQVGLTEGSDLSKLRERIRIYDQLQTAENNLAAARNADTDALDSDPYRKGAAKESLVAYKVALDERLRAAALAEQAGVGEGSGFNRAAAGRQADLLRERRDEALDPEKMQAARERLIKAELALAVERLESEGRIDALRLKGFDREMLLLDVEMRKLEATREADRIDEQGYRREKDLLEARKAALREEAGRRREEVEGRLAIDRLQRRETGARDRGDQGEARRLRREREALEDARARREAEREAKDLNLTGGQRRDFVDRRLSEDRQAREEARRREERDRSITRDRERAGVGRALAELRGRLLRGRGRTDEARRVEETAARRQDEAERRELRRRFIEQGFAGRDATELANRQIKTNQANRLLEQLGGQGSRIVASSLASIGGGGGVAGVDPAVNIQKRMAELLEEIADNTRESVDMDDW